MAPSTGKTSKKKKSTGKDDNPEAVPFPVVASRKASSSTASTSRVPSAASSRANSPFAGSSTNSGPSNALLGMLSPGLGSKLPSFKKKASTPANATTEANGTASSRKRHDTVAALEESMPKAAPKRAASVAKQKKEKEPVLPATIAKASKGKQKAAAIEWTSSEGEEEEEVAPIPPPKATKTKTVPNRGKGKAPAKDTSKSKGKSKQKDAEIDGFVTTGIGIEEVEQGTPITSNGLVDEANKGATSVPPVAQVTPVPVSADASPSPVPPPYKTFSQPSTNPPSPVIAPSTVPPPIPPTVIEKTPKAEPSVPLPQQELIEAQEPVDLDDAFNFDLDAQILAASSLNRVAEPGSIPQESERHERTISGASLGLFVGNEDLSGDLDMEIDMEIEGEDEAILLPLADLHQHQQPGPSQTGSKENSDDDDEEDDLFDFDKHLAAVMGGESLAAPGDSVLGGLTPSNPFAYALLPSPEKKNDDLPTSHLAEHGMPDASADFLYRQVIPPDSPPPVAETETAETANGHTADSDDEEDGDAGDLNFDLNAMLANAMQQATSQVEQEGSPRDSVEQRPDGDRAAKATLKPSSLKITLKVPRLAAAAKQEKVDSDSEIDELDEDDEDEDGFDLDAQLQAAMAGNLETWGDSPMDGQQHGANGKAANGGIQIDEGDTSDSDDADEEAGFDLDAHIGAAMGDLGMESGAAEASKAAVAAQTGGFDPNDLQAMLKGAMRQAALELELEVDDLNEAELDELMDYDEDEEGEGGDTMDRHRKQYRQAAGLYDEMDVDSGGKPDKLPERPRFRPVLTDDGDRDNAFNIARRTNPQSLHTAYACDHPGCDRVFARLRNREKHRTTHTNNPSLPFQCSNCPVQFADVQGLTDHSWTHTDSREWRYRCNGCYNLFGEKAVLDRHAAAAATVAGASWSEKCRRGEFTLAFMPVAALRKAANNQIQMRASSAPGERQISGTPAAPAQFTSDIATSKPPAAASPFFQKSTFDSTPLVAAALVNQLSTILAQQYDRQNSLLTPTDPRIDIPLALSQTLTRANLTASECAALASVLATVGHARNEGLKASLSEARNVQIQNLQRQHEHQDRIRAELKRRQAEKERLEIQKKERIKAALEASGGDIPVPELEIPTS